MNDFSTEDLKLYRHATDDEYNLARILHAVAFVYYQEGCDYPINDLTSFEPAPIYLRQAIALKNSQKTLEMLMHALHKIKCDM